MKLFKKKNKGEKTEYEQLRDSHAEYREACKDLDKTFAGWEKRMNVMNKEARAAAASLAKACGCAGLSGVIDDNTIVSQNDVLQGHIDEAKQALKTIIAENSETRKMVDDRDKAEKVMHHKESTAEKAEKKQDEKAPQYRDDANRATEDFKLLDSQLMERLRAWQQTKGEVFNRVYRIVSDVLTAPNSVGGGGGGGGGAAVISTPASYSTPSPAGGSAPLTRESTIPSRTPVAVPVPADVSMLSAAELDDYLNQINDQIPKSRREKDELEKLAQMYKKDPESSAKALAEAEAVDREIATMEADHRRLAQALQAVQSSSVVESSDAMAGATYARALYDFVAEREEELSLKAGDVVLVIDDSDTDGWWEGTLQSTSATGFFPASYCEKVAAP